MVSNSFKQRHPMVRIGIDIGSTTGKMVVLDERGRELMSAYERHNAKAGKLMVDFLAKAKRQLGDIQASVSITGSVGMGVAEKCGLAFIQEVVAATKAVYERHDGVRSMIDIGGEDAKIVFFRNGNATDLRMNGNCAGGTSAFIDQMAILLGVETKELDTLASRAKTLYPIASRCGVFSKTDVQNLMAKGASKEDIAASVFHAVAVQVVVTLAHGCDITPPVLLCGGPLTFLPALRRAVAEYLKIDESEMIIPADSHLLPAFGAALSADTRKPAMLSELMRILDNGLKNSIHRAGGLEPIFADADDYAAWKRRIESNDIKLKPLTAGPVEATLGIDSGSTTTKIVVLDNEGNMLFHYYHNNNGDPAGTARRGIQLFHDECKAAGADVTITGSCSTGYGEDLIKASLNLDHGIIETIAHYVAARRMDKDVSFILDIGGQDMKAVFVNNGVINRMEINEACSSGCGSFIETFAKSLGFGVNDFARTACEARSPYDLGTRCTVFMNSKVKQALREGASIADIAAGLSYSVIKNCLYKVLRLKDVNELGSHIVVQGGTMRNDSVVRAFEKLTGKKVLRSDHPELMGAAGCAIYARENGNRRVKVEELLGNADFTTKRQQCRGCENRCLVTAYKFNGGNRYYSGNRCEKVFNNKGEQIKPGLNAYDEKLRLLFDRTTEVPAPIAVIGVPRCLNMFEEYPFWHTLLTECGLQVVLSSPSTFSDYEKGAKHVMSDNICFPAKLAHSHIADLVNKRVDRVFMPFVVYEKPDGGQNSYNCPVVSGYAEVIKGTDDSGTPIDSPAITFKDKKLLLRQCAAYLSQFGVPKSKVKAALDKALAAQNEYCQELKQLNRSIMERSKAEGKLTILLAGRPYHADQLIQHKLSEMVASMGVNVITEDIARLSDIRTDDTNFVPQWAYANRILRSAEWAARQGDLIQFMQMTSFGCGPDAFLTDETRALLKRHGKTLTLLKIDDVSNIGSLKLRVRSVVESMRLSVQEKKAVKTVTPFVRTPIFGKDDKRRKIIAPFFTPFISPLIPPLVKVAGYDADCLPMSDTVSCDLGLRYANNEVCYPATLIVGDIVKAFNTNRYNAADTAVIITQTGGQCRASNYISLIKKALTEAGYKDVPVLSLASGSGIDNEQPGFKVNWAKVFPLALATVIYSDCMAKLYYATVPREKEKGMAAALITSYLDRAKTVIEEKDSHALWRLLASAAMDFNDAITDKKTDKVGIVGEIYLKFNPFAQKGITTWLTGQGIEIVPPLLTDFFLQSFVNTRVNQAEHLERKILPNTLIRLIYNKVWHKIEQANRICSRFSCFTPFESIFSKADEASKVISLYAQFGEGWLLPGEILGMARQGIRHVISLQPFGCIANHIVAKGIEKRIKRLCPDLDLLFLDFDSGVSDVNIRNRILLFINNLRDNADMRTAPNRNI